MILEKSTHKSHKKLQKVDFVGVLENMDILKSTHEGGEKCKKLLKSAKTSWIECNTI